MWWLNDATSWDPFSELRRLQRDMNRLVTGYQGNRGVFPAVNLWGDDDKFVLTAELPGLDASEINVSVQGDQVTLQGERKADAKADSVTCHRLERGTGRFSRTLRLPYEVDGDHVDAAYRQGVLTVTMPRAATSRPRKIEIQQA